MRGAGVLSNKASEQSGAQVECVAALSNGRVVSGSGDRTLKVWEPSSRECLQTLSGHTRSARRRRPVEPRVARSSTPRRAQVRCVAVLSNGNIVSGGSWDRMLKVWNVLTGTCLQTLSGHMGGVRHRRPIEPRADCSPTPRRAQVWCVAVLSHGRVVSGSGDGALKVWDATSGSCLQTLTGHTDRARRRRPVKPRGRLLVDAATGAGLVRRRPAERRRRLRVGRQHAQGVGRCRGEDGTSGCRAPDSEEFRWTSHRRVPLGLLVCFVPRRVGAGCNFWFSLSAADLYHPLRIRRNARGLGLTSAMTRAAPIRRRPEC